MSCRVNSARLVADGAGMTSAEFVFMSRLVWPETVFCVHANRWNFIRCGREVKLLFAGMKIPISDDRFLNTLNCTVPRIAFVMGFSENKKSMRWFAMGNSDRNWTGGLAGLWRSGIRIGFRRKRGQGLRWILGKQFFYIKQIQNWTKLRKQNLKIGSKKG